MEKQSQQNYFCRVKFFTRNTLIELLWLQTVLAKINIFIKKLFIKHKLKFKVSFNFTNNKLLISY